MSVRAFDGTRILLTDKRWKHIILRHPELENKLFLVLDAVANPDEVYVDRAGAFHALKKLHGELSDYIVVVYYRENKEGYIRTAFYTSCRRKARRYRRFKKLKPS
jgi:predicted transposase YbfD/YdcC